MPLNKQAIPINFSQGLDTKTDPKQVQIGKFLALQNSIFTKGGLLSKRNGYGQLPSLPQSASYSTTFNADLTVIGSSIQALPTNSQQWVNKGSIQPLQLSALPLIRNNLNQTQSDCAIATNGFACTVYTESNGSTNAYKYAVSDSTTGQNIVAPTALTNADPMHGTPRVFVLGNNFIIVYAAKLSTVYNLVYIAVSVNNPSSSSAQAVISASYLPAGPVAFDAAVLGNSLYLAWEGAGTTGVKMTYLTSTLSLGSTINPDPSHVSTSMSVTVDTQNNVIWASYYSLVDGNGYSLAVDPQLNLIANFPTQIISSPTILNITSAAQNGILTVFYEYSNTASGIQTNYVASVMVALSTGVVTSEIVVLRSVGLASKAFIIDGIIYFLAAYSSSFQPTYFLVNGSISTSASPALIAKLAYENGGGYLTNGLPSVTVDGSTASIAYLYKDLIEAVSDSNSAGTITTGGVYSQTGINLVSFNFGTAGLITAEIGANLNITGGFLWAYDGYSLTEQGFHLYPDSVQETGTATTGGHMIAQIYYYQATYEWTDNQGNAFRSAGSIPIKVDLTASMTATNEVTITVPTLRITAKTANPVKIVVYRWSTAQQNFYQITSVAAPILNDSTTDSITFTDPNSDASILGNNIIYTTGGVIEDIGAPAFKSVFLFDDRLFGITAEDPNLLWLSKQVIEATPVEMSDLLTMYIAPNVGAQGPSGALLCGFPMDDKACIFKASSILYFNGTGPDNTGANSQYSPPLLITSTVGCSNQNSIVFMPNGLMFEFKSEAGNQIWLLGRDLSTQYIGAPVEAFTQNATVQSAVNIPGSNQVRFTMSSGVTLMYDYYYGQWGTFVGVPALSSTLYQGLHTFIDQYDRVFQETPGQYLDGGNPVLLSFSTSWLSLAGLQGYQRAYFFYLLGTYFTPHKLNLLIAYDYNSSPVQNTLISPINYGPAYGSSAMPVYGQLNPYGGGSSDSGASSNIEQWRVFLSKQRCTSFQITLQEIYDPSFGEAAGQGFTLSGLNLVVGIKKGWRPQPSATSAG